MSRVTASMLGLVLAASALLGASGCHRNTAPLTVFVPCGQIGPFYNIEKLWKQQNPGVPMTWKFDNMVVMTDKVLSGASKPDVFLSMGDLEVDRLQKAGLVVEGTRAQYADNAVAITVPIEDPGGVSRIEDLANPSVKRIAVPDPEKNSVGRHAIEALKAAGVYSQVEGKIAQTAYAADGKEMSEGGQVEATFAYYPCVSEVHVPGQPPAEVTGIKVVMVPQQDYHVFSCEAVVLKGAKNPEAGRKLIALLKSPEAQKIFAQWNFRRDLAPAAPAAK